MQIHTTVRHFELDPGDKEFALQRLTRLERYARDLGDAHMVVTAEGYRHRAEITLHLKGRELTSREEANEARMAIELAVDSLEEQLRRLKEWRVDRKRRAGSNGIEPAAESTGTDSEEEE
jgi:putative sigma-54 modulation protein